MEIAGSTITKSTSKSILLSFQFWPMWSKSRQALGQLPIGRTALSG